MCKIEVIITLARADYEDANNTRRAVHDCTGSLALMPIRNARFVMETILFIYIFLLVNQGGHTRVEVKFPVFSLC